MRLWLPGEASFSLPLTPHLGEHGWVAIAQNECLNLVIGLGTLSDHLKKSRYYEDTAELEPKLGRWEDTKSILGIRYFLSSVSLFLYPPCTPCLPLSTCLCSSFHAVIFLLLFRLFILPCSAGFPYQPFSVSALQIQFPSHTLTNLFSSAAVILTY